MAIKEKLEQLKEWQLETLALDLKATGWGLFKKQSLAGDFHIF